jgi:hypothetical protein
MDSRKTGSVQLTLAIIGLILISTSGISAPRTQAADTAAKGPVKIFVLIGQSNMNGRGNIKVLKEKLIKDLPKQYPPSLMTLRKDVWIFGANGDGISGQKDNKHLEPGFGQWKYYGPELGFGHVVGDKIDQQVLLIKLIAGGTALGKQWVSPAIAKRTGRPIGVQYKRFIRETITTIHQLPDLYKNYDQGQGYQLCGVFWVQGHADGGSLRDEYEQNLVDFIKDARRDLAIPDLPFIAGESLAGKPPSEAYAKAVDRVNKEAGNKQAATILSKSKIKLTGPDYAPYNAAGDRTHWRHNSRAYLDVGIWAAELILPMVAETKDHSKDKKLQEAWKTVLLKVKAEEK